MMWNNYVIHYIMYFMKVLLNLDSAVKTLTY